MTVTFTLTDGMLGDDTAVDGVIVDPGGLAQPVPVVPGLSPSALLALVALLLGAGALLLRGRLRLAN